jgi:hypothetical protein
MMPFFIIELGVGSFAFRDRTLVIKSAWKTIWTESHSQAGGWLSRQAKPYWTDDHNLCAVKGLLLRYVRV